MINLIFWFGLDEEMTSKTRKNENDGSQEGSEWKKVWKAIAEVDVDVTVEIE